MKIEEFKFPSSDGEHTLAGIAWLPDDGIKVVGILQIAHGMMEHIRRYENFASFLTENGWIVVGNDHLGHGRSTTTPDELGYFTKKKASKTVVDDIYFVLTETKKRYPDLPYYILGHSMGSFLIRRFLMTYGSEVDGAIIMGTGSQPTYVVKGGRLIVWFIKLFKGAHYRSTFVNRLCFGSDDSPVDPDYVGNWCTKDEEIIAKNANDPYGDFIFTLNGFAMLLSTIDYIQKKSNIRKIPKDLPIIFLSGADDSVGNCGVGVKQVYDSYIANGINNISMKLYDGDRHEILNEVDRQVVYSDILRWLQN